MQSSFNTQNLAILHSNSKELAHSLYGDTFILNRIASLISKERDFTISLIEIFISFQELDYEIRSALDDKKLCFQSKSNFVNKTLNDFFSIQGPQSKALKEFLATVLSGNFDKNKIVLDKESIDELKKHIILQFASFDPENKQLIARVESVRSKNSTQFGEKVSTTITDSNTEEFEKLRSEYVLLQLEALPKSKWCEKVFTHIVAAKKSKEVFKEAVDVCFKGEALPNILDEQSMNFLFFFARYGMSSSEKQFKLGTGDAERLGANNNFLLQHLQLGQNACISNAHLLQILRALKFAHNNQHPVIIFLHHDNCSAVLTLKTENSCISLKTWKSSADLDEQVTEVASLIQDILKSVKIEMEALDFSCSDNKLAAVVAAAYLSKDGHSKRMPFANSNKIVDKNTLPLMLKNHLVLVQKEKEEIDRDDSQKESKKDSSARIKLTPEQVTSPFIDNLIKSAMARYDVNTISVTLVKEYCKEQDIDPRSFIEAMVKNWGGFQKYFTSKISQAFYYHHSSKQVVKNGVNIAKKPALNNKHSTTDQPSQLTSLESEHTAYIDKIISNVMAHFKRDNVILEDVRDYCFTHKIDYNELLESIIENGGSFEGYFAEGYSQKFCYDPAKKQVVEKIITPSKASSPKPHNTMSTDSNAGQDHFKPEAFPELKPSSIAENNTTNLLEAPQTTSYKQVLANTTDIPQSTVVVVGTVSTAPQKAVKAAEAAESVEDVKAEIPQPTESHTAPQKAVEAAKAVEDIKAEISQLNESRTALQKAVEEFKKQLEEANRSKLTSDAEIQKLHTNSNHLQQANESLQTQLREAKTLTENYQTKIQELAAKCTGLEQTITSLQAQTKQTQQNNSSGASNEIDALKKHIDELKKDLASAHYDYKVIRDAAEIDRELKRIYWTFAYENGADFDENDKIINHNTIPKTTNQKTNRQVQSTNQKDTNRLTDENAELKKQIQQFSLKDKQSSDQITKQESEILGLKESLNKEAQANQKLADENATLKKQVADNSLETKLKQLEEKLKQSEALNAKLSKENADLKKPKPQDTQLQTQMQQTAEKLKQVESSNASYKNQVQQLQSEKAKAVQEAKIQKEIARESSGKISQLEAANQALVGEIENHRKAAQLQQLLSQKNNTIATPSIALSAVLPQPQPSIAAEAANQAPKDYTKDLGLQLAPGDEKNFKLTVLAYDIRKKLNESEPASEFIAEWRKQTSAPEKTQIERLGKSPNNFNRISALHCLARYSCYDALKKLADKYDVNSKTAFNMLLTAQDSQKRTPLIHCEDFAAIYNLKGENYLKTKELLESRMQQSLKM